MANVSDSAGFIVATDQLIGSYSDAWLRSDAWADPDTTEPVWYENVRVFHWIEPAANQTDGLVVEKFIQKLGAYLPAHAHPKSPVRLYLLSGSILLIMDGRITVLKPGERAFIPDDKEHAVFASEDSECVSVHYEVGGLTISERYGAGDIVGDVFSALRGRFLAHDNESGSHFEFINKIQNYGGFVYGVIVGFNEGGNAIILEASENPQLKNITLPSHNYFLSTVIHNHKTWSPNKSHIFTDTLCANGESQEDWYEIHSFSDLPDPTRNHLLSHFSENDGGRVCVYCPFVIPNNKPLANYVGFYAEINPAGAGNPFLEHIGTVQHAGTLVFSRLAIANALSSKSEKLKEPLDALRRLRKELETVGSAIGQIEAIMNPHYLHLAKQEIQDFAEALSTIYSGDFHNISHGDKCWGTASVPQRNEKLVLFSEISQAHSEKIQNALSKVDGQLYADYYCDFSSVESGAYDDCVNQIYLAKALHKKRLPYVWLLKSLDSAITSNDWSQMIVLGEEVPPFSFCLALRALRSEGAIITPTISNSTFSLGVTIKPKSGYDIAELWAAVLTKISADAFSLSDGHTSSALAIIIKASEEYAREKYSAPGNSVPLYLKYSKESIE